MSNNEDDYEDDYEDGYENEYKKFQERYKGLRKEWKDDSDDWSDEQKHRHPENMKIANDEYVCRSNLPPKTIAQPVLIS